MSELNLPGGWLDVRWEDVTSLDGFRRGPFGGNLKKSFFVAEGYSVYEQYAPINDDCTKFRYFIDEAKYQELSSFSVEVGDFLISCSGTMGRITKVPVGAPKGVINQALLRIRLAEGALKPEYFLKLFRSPLIQERVLKKSGGGAIQNLAAVKELKEIRLPFPPLNEQTRIANKLDELLAQVDTIKARVDAIPAILKRFRQSVLAAAVSGKLTEEWRMSADSEDIATSLAMILEERATRVSKRNLEPQSHLVDEEYEIPDTWRWVSLDLLSSKIVDGVHHKPEYVESGIPFMSVKDIKGGKISFSNCKYITEETHQEISPRCNPERGDLLITKSGTIGRTAIIETDDVFDLFVSVALIKPASSTINMKFIDFALQKWISSIDVANRVVGTAIKNLHLRDMRVLAIPFPPIEEQKQIVQRVEQLFAFADQVEQRVADAQSRIESLTQSILAKAFRGELVPQDPNDEPASELLARIQKEREEAAALLKAAKESTKKPAKKSARKPRLKKAASE